jgi:hypothetical protein
MLTVAILGGEDLKERDWVGNPGKEAAKIEGVAESFPEDPMFVSGSGSARYDSGRDWVLDRAKVSAESMCGCKWHRAHGLFCGYDKLNKDRSCELLRSH